MLRVLLTQGLVQNRQAVVTEHLLAQLADLIFILYHPIVREKETVAVMRLGIQVVAVLLEKRCNADFDIAQAYQAL